MYRKWWYDTTNRTLRLICLFVTGLVYTVLLRLVSETSLVGSFRLVLETSVTGFNQSWTSHWGSKGLQTGVKIGSWLVSFFYTRGLVSISYGRRCIGCRSKGSGCRKLVPCELRKGKKRGYFERVRRHSETVCFHYHGLKERSRPTYWRWTRLSLTETDKGVTNDPRDMS